MASSQQQKTFTVILSTVNADAAHQVGQEAVKRSDVKTVHVDGSMVYLVCEAPGNCHHSIFGRISDTFKYRRTVKGYPTFQPRAITSGTMLQPQLPGQKRAAA